MLRKLLLYLCLATLTQCSKCKKDDPQPGPEAAVALPPETQTGAGTFGCLVNGQIFVCLYPTLRKGDWMSPTRFSLGTGINLNGQRDAQSVTLISIINGQLQNNQTFLLVSAATPFPIFTPGINQFVSSASGDKRCYYSGNYIKTGQVELVKFDPFARIAAGRFAFKLYEPGGCDTLRITQGRFDVKF